MNHPSGTIDMNESHGGEAGYEPTVTIQLLPRCANCHQPHPLARKPVQPAGECPDCGTPTGGMPDPVVERAIFSGLDPLSLLGRAMRWIGFKLFALARKV